MSRAVIGGNTTRLTDGDKELVLRGSYTPTDAISDLVEAVERLQTATSADCLLVLKTRRSCIGRTGMMRISCSGLRNSTRKCCAKRYEKELRHSLIENVAWHDGL